MSAYPALLAQPQVFQRAMDSYLKELVTKTFHEDRAAGMIHPDLTLDEVFVHAKPVKIQLVHLCQDEAGTIIGVIGSSGYVLSYVDTENDKELRAVLALCTDFPGVFIEWPEATYEIMDITPVSSEDGQEPQRHICKPGTQEPIKEVLMRERFLERPKPNLKIVH